MSIIRTVFLVAVLALHAFAAGAVEFNKISDKSSIDFIYKQMNVPMAGNFKVFSGNLVFDPAKPNAGSARLDIDLSSIDTGASDADEEVRGKLWFNTKAFPQAQFLTTGIKPIAPGLLEVNGKLSIKGKTRDVTSRVSFHQDGGNAVFEGALVIRRADFGIGEGIWADFGTVANEVQIKFRLIATSVVQKK